MVPAPALPRSPLPISSDADTPPSSDLHLRRRHLLRPDAPPPPPVATSDTPPPPSSRHRHAREISSRYRSPLSSDAAPPPPRCRSPALPPSRHHRFSSPSVDRSAEPSALSPSLKRAASAERRRFPPSDAGGGTLRQQQQQQQQRSGVRSDLWPPSSSRNLTASTQAEPWTASPTSAAGAGVGGAAPPLSHPPSDHTLKPSVNAAPRLPSPDRRKPTPERKGTPLPRHRSAADQAENAKPPPHSDGRFATAAAPPLQKPEASPLVVRHRWPSSLSSLKLYGAAAAAAATKSVDLCSPAAAPAERPPSRSSSRSSVNLLQSRPTSFSSQVIPARVFSQTINDGAASAALRAAARKLSLESKLRQRSGGGGGGGGGGGESPSPASVRRTTPQRTTAAAAAAHAEADRVRRFDGGGGDADEEAAEYDGSASPRMSQEFGIWKKSNRSGSGRSRTPSDNVSKQRAAELYGGGAAAAGMRLPPARVAQKMAAEAAAWLPYGGGGGYQHSPARLSSSSPMRRAAAAAAAASPPMVMMQYGVDFRRTKKGLSMVDAVYLHRILHNRLLQWRFANARADYANTTQRHAGEKQLFSVWAKTAEIRKSVTTKRLKLQQARQAQKINSVLRSQGCKLEYWWSILQQEHRYALSGAVEALEAAVLRLPVDEGVKAETHAVKEAMASAVEVVKAVEHSVHHLLPKLEKSNMVISELAEIADQERTLLEECGDVLLLVSSLQMEESSLQMQLLQFEQEKARVLGLLIMDGH